MPQLFRPSIDCEAGDLRRERLGRFGPADFGERDWCFCVEPRCVPLCPWNFRASPGHASREARSIPKSSLTSWKCTVWRSQTIPTALQLQSYELGYEVQLEEESELPEWRQTALPVHPRPAPEAGRLPLRPSLGGRHRTLVSPNQPPVGRANAEVGESRDRYDCDERGIPGAARERWKRAKERELPELRREAGAGAAVEMYGVDQSAIGVAPKDRNCRVVQKERTRRANM